MWLHITDPGHEDIGKSNGVSEMTKLREAWHKTCPGPGSQSLPWNRVRCFLLDS